MIDFRDPPVFKYNRFLRVRLVVTMVIVGYLFGLAFAPFLGPSVAGLVTLSVWCLRGWAMISSKIPPELRHAT